MKTIDINLIGDLGKIPVKAKKQPLLSMSDGNENYKYKTMSIVVVSFACVVFLLALLIWFAALYSIKKDKKELSTVTQQNEVLKVDLTRYTNLQKDLLFEKKILDLKMVAETQIEEAILPWSKVIGYIGSNVPKSIKLTGIKKGNDTSDSNPDSVSVEISGQVDKVNGSKPLEQISFFVLNLNEHSLVNSQLTDSTIKNVQFDDKLGKYSFVIQAFMNKPKDDGGANG